MENTVSGPTAEEEQIPPAILFAASLLYSLLVLGAALIGGWALAAAPLLLWGGASVLDIYFRTPPANPTAMRAKSSYPWHYFLLLLWVPIQIAMIFISIYVVSNTDWFSTAEAIGLMFSVGAGSGTFGVTYAHELMHRRRKLHRAAAEILLYTVCYGHFITEHLRGHHRYVCTPRDPATSRYNEGIYHFLARVLPGSLVSAWHIECERKIRQGKPVFSLNNPIWRYITGSIACLFLAWILADYFGLLLFMIQSVVAILLTESINYIQHYGLTRKHLGAGRYEHTRQRHSWNAPLPATSAMLINLQRHSDHHFKPEQPFPALQSYPPEIAPRLPYGYPVMVAIAVSPQLWRWFMNRRVRQWRRLHYPEITDWTAYNTMALPNPH